ncbi:hypothetical protein BDQ17DRAFT_1336035 [Cyathus striatus]|nr:hypothetical protein BDQ17DRAFT_1336035 [Cyathus striatus]
MALTIDGYCHLNTMVNWDRRASHSFKAIEKDISEIERAWSLDLIVDWTLLFCRWPSTFVLACSMNDQILGVLKCGLESGQRVEELLEVRDTSFLVSASLPNPSPQPFI